MRPKGKLHNVKSLGGSQRARLHRRQWDLRRDDFVLGGNMASRRPAKTTKSLLTMHDWEAKHYILAAVIILVVMGMFAYSWS